MSGNFLNPSLFLLATGAAENQMRRLRPDQDKDDKLQVKFG